MDCVILSEGRRELLLIRRANEPFKDCWALPGGFLELDETLEQGAARELEEETGVKGVTLRQLGAFDRVDRDPRERVVSVAFVAEVRRSECKPMAGDDAKEAKWFSVRELPRLAFDHEDIIDAALKS